MVCDGVAVGCGVEAESSGLLVSKELESDAFARSGAFIGSGSILITGRCGFGDGGATFCAGRSGGGACRVSWTPVGGVMTAGVSLGAKDTLPLGVVVRGEDMFVDVSMTGARSSGGSTVNDGADAGALA
jgi:hypothetical protein